MNVTAYCRVEGFNVLGEVKFCKSKQGGYTKVRVKVVGLSTGNHGIHVHEYGDTSNGCLSVGQHFNPLPKSSGSE